MLGRVLRGIDNVRDGYAWVVQRLVRVAALSLLGVAVFAVGIYFCGTHYADRLPAGGRPGRLLHRRPASGRRVGVAHRRGGGDG